MNFLARFGEDDDVEADDVENYLPKLYGIVQNMKNLWLLPHYSTVALVKKEIRYQYFDIFLKSSAELVS